MREREHVCEREKEGREAGREKIEKDRKMCLLQDFVLIFQM